jgi:predicted methyltransferase
MRASLLAGAVFALLTVHAAAWAQSPAIAAAVASPDRPKADAGRDALRHPAELIAFAGLKPGDQVADLIPGQGYYTRIFSNLVGPTGHVYAVVPAELAKEAPKMMAAMKALSSDTAFANVSLVQSPIADIATAKPLDAAWTSDNYHDIYGFFGAAEAAKFDAAVFRALKPGGVFIVIDHVAKPGTSGTSPTTLHRIDPETVKTQVLAAGFTLAAASDVLRNPADTHDLKVFAPQIRGRTDQFAFKFVKPEK